MVGKIKKITKTQYDYLNKRIDSVAGFHVKIKSYDKVISELVSHVITLNKSVEILQKQIEELKEKTRNLPIKVYGEKKLIKEGKNKNVKNKKL